MAAQQLVDAGCNVHVFDAMASVGRKFLLAGIGGLNLTHAEPPSAFVLRYGKRSPWVSRWLADFGADEVRAWAQG
ncbi:MAG: NAD(P)/FAD-dependent oxidoreductase, partial [Giesbergeria sp.]